MTELERARAHLRLCQMLLADRRRLGWDGPSDEEMVLAALSWMHEEQQKQKQERIDLWIRRHARAS
jgi:hypothetical protein